MPDQEVMGKVLQFPVRRDLTRCGDPNPKYTVGPTRCMRLKGHSWTVRHSDGVEEWDWKR